jgi:predicted Na+-dependent transporter
MKQHFSKLALWLLILIMSVQAHVMYQTQGFGFLTDIFKVIPLFAAFTLISYGVGYYSAKKLGFLEKTARSIGFVSGSKGIAVALFIAAQLSGEAVVAVSIYYFVRQAVCGGIAEYYNRSISIEKTLRSFNS